MNELSVILPVYNEVQSLEQVLNEWREELNHHNTTYQFIICEDGSTDGTKELLSKIGDSYNLILNQKNYRRGYGKAVIDGIKSADSEYILCLDSDGQCDPADLPKFLQNKNNADIIIGWRTERKDALQRKIFSLLFKTLFKTLFPVAIHDPSAPYVLFRKEIILPYLSGLFYLKEGFWWGFIGTCAKAGLTIKEIPINHRPRLNGNTNVYHPKKIPNIAFRNIIGLFRLKAHRLASS